MKSVLSVPSFLIAIFAWGALSCSSTKDDIRVVPDSKLLKLMIGTSNFENDAVTAVMRNDSIVPDLLTLNSPAHSIAKVHSWIWVVCEGYVRVVKPSDYSTLGTIAHMSEDLDFQYIVPVKSGQVAVSDAALGAVFLVDEKDFKITKEILFNRPVGQMIVTGSKLYAAAGDRICAFQLDKTYQTSELEIPARPDSKLVSDKFGALWALSADYLYCVSDTTMAAHYSLSALGIDASEGYLEIDSERDEMYFNALKNGKLSVFEITVGDEKGRIELNPTPLFTLDAVENMTGMVMSPRNTLYVGDAKSGTGSGVVYEYDLYGRILNTYAVNGTPGALFADR